MNEQSIPSLQKVAHFYQLKAKDWADVYKYHLNVNILSHFRVCFVQVCENVANLCVM